MIKVVVDTNVFVSSFLAEIPEKLLIYGETERFICVFAEKL